MYWLNEATGVLASGEQLDADGNPIPGQELVEDDDPRVAAILNPPEPPPEPTTRELIAALDAKDRGAPADYDALVARVK